MHYFLLDTLQYVSTIIIDTLQYVSTIIIDTLQYVSTIIIVRKILQEEIEEEEKNFSVPFMHMGSRYLFWCSNITGEPL